MELDKLFVRIFRIAGAVLLFIVAFAILLNVAGFMIIGGQVKSSADVSLCKLALTNCMNLRLSGIGDCRTTCLPCKDSFYDACLRSDMSIFA